jgi:hypothetical protein
MILKNPDKPSVKIELLDKLKTPPLKNDSLAINIKRYFTDIDGVVVDKNTVPAELQTRYPFYIFGEFDRQGGYQICNRLQGAYSNAYVYLCTFVYGVSNPLFFGFNNLSDIQQRISVGDVVTVYTDSLSIPSYFIWVVISCPKTSLASILSNCVTGNSKSDTALINVERLNYVTDNIEQWDVPVMSWVVDFVGNPKYDFIDPVQFRTPETVNDKFVEMKLKFPLNQYRGLNSYILFDTETLQLNFKIRKI